MENCKLSGINPHDWLTRTLIALANGHPPTTSAASCHGQPWSERIAYTHTSTRMTTRYRGKAAFRPRLPVGHLHRNSSAADDGDPTVRSRDAGVKWGAVG